MALALRPRRPVHQELQCLTLQFRSFSVSQRQCGHKQALANSHAKLPEYPYGPSRWYKQSNFGLYGGLKISSGNNVSPKTETKSRRKWRPNIQMKRLYSHALDRYVRVKVATRVLRTIDKVGGLDEYLVGEKPARIKELGMKGWALRCKVMDTPWWMQRKVQQRQELGLSPIRTYFPDEMADEAGREVLVGMYGEKLQEAALAAQTQEEMPELEEADAQYDKDGNLLELPDLIAYDDAQDSTNMEAADAQENTFKEVGRLVEAPEFEYVSAKHKRRAIIAEKKELTARIRAAFRARKAEEQGITAQQALRSNDLKQHLAYQQKQDALEAAGSMLAAADSAASNSDGTRPSL